MAQAGILSLAAGALMLWAGWLERRVGTTTMLGHMPSREERKRLPPVFQVDPSTPGLTKQERLGLARQRALVRIAPWSIMAGGVCVVAGIAVLLLSAIAR